MIAMYLCSLQPHEASGGQQSDPTKADSPMDLVFVTSEVAPWSKTGGLGDVMGSLPIAMARRGHRVMVVAPRWVKCLYVIVRESAFWNWSTLRAQTWLGQIVERARVGAPLDACSHVFVCICAVARLRGCTRL